MVAAECCVSDVSNADDRKVRLGVRQRYVQALSVSHLLREGSCPLRFDTTFGAAMWYGLVLWQGPDAPPRLQRDLILFAFQFAPWHYWPSVSEICLLGGAQWCEYRRGLA